MSGPSRLKQADWGWRLGYPNNVRALVNLGNKF